MLPSPTPTATLTLTPSPAPTLTPPPGHRDDGGGGLGLLLILAALVYVIGYAISVQLHPLRTCRTCDGTGLNRGGIFTGSMRVCRRCGGTRREPRPGARNLGRRDR